MKATIMKKLLTNACLFVVTTIAIISFIAPTVFGQGKKTAKVNSSPAESVTARVDKFPSDSSLRALLQEMVGSGRATGIVVGLVDADGSRRIISYGSSGPDRLPLDGHSVFEIGSITKVFTATLLADMVLRGEVRLDDPLAKYLPSEVKVPSRNGKVITLLDLTTHYSGLPRGYPRGPGELTDYSVQEIYEFLSGYELPRDPGATFEYSNLGMGLLGYALARRAGTTYEKLVTKRILGPLGMPETAITLTPAMQAHLVHGYDGFGDTVPNNNPTLAGAGALRSTAVDMLSFAAANLSLRKGSLYEAMRSAHMARRTALQADSVGFNWVVSRPKDRVLTWHGGGTGGYQTFLGLDLAARRAVVVLTNSGGGGEFYDLGWHLLDPAFPLNLPPVRLAVVQAYRAGGAADAIARYRNLKAMTAEAWVFDEQQLNDVGYWLLRRGRSADAVAIFRLNVEMYPGAANPYDSLGEAYLALGDTAQAIKNYKRSVELDPKNTSGFAVLKKLGGPQDTRVTRGNQSTIIISLKTAEGPACHCSNASLASMYFTDARSVNAYYAENSYGLMSISGTVTGPYVVRLEKNWSLASVANDADAAATAAGVNLSLYSRKVYILPKEADPHPIRSAWGGRSDTGSRTWIRDYWCSSRWIATHELGHNFGEDHASTYTDDYGDYSSSMGGWVDPLRDPSTWNNMPHYNAPEKIATGWIPASAVETVTAKGRFQVASVETVPAPGQVQALKIKGANGGTNYYYFSYRQAVGFSSGLKPQYVGTTSVTRWNGTTGAKTYLLANLADGQAFTDESGLTVTQRSHDASHAYITVSFDTPTTAVNLFGTAVSNSRLALSPDRSALVYTLEGAPTSTIYELDVSPILRAIGKH
jgi:D-alanyl-D-alanine-carboxypeptidase/D-alanyl-D-alanine-endopeptidase